MSAIPATAPTVVQHPMAQTVAPGGNVVLMADVFGAAPSFQQWLKEDGIIPGATNQELSITSAQPTDAGLCALRITNAFGMVTSAPAALVVGGVARVEITAQPQAETLGHGETLALTVAATGTQPLAYQWHRGGAAIPGATNAIFTVTNAAAGNSGMYHAVVSNRHGAQSSISVVVSVADAPFPLVALTNHFWRYEQSGTNPGTA